MATSLLSFFACVGMLLWARTVSSLLSAVETSMRSVAASFHACVRGSMWVAENGYQGGVVSLHAYVRNGLGKDPMEGVWK